MSLLNILIITANQTLAYEYHQRLLGTAYKVSSGWVFPLSKAKTYESLEIYFVGGDCIVEGGNFVGESRNFQGKFKIA